MGVSKMIRCLFVLENDNDLSLFKGKDSYYFDDSKRDVSDIKIDSNMILGEANIIDIEKLEESVNLNTHEVRFHTNNLTHLKILALGMTQRADLLRFRKQGDIYCYELGKFREHMWPIELWKMNLYANIEHTKEIRNRPNDWCYAYLGDKRVILKTVDPIAMCYLLENIQRIVFSHKKANLTGE